MTESAARSPVEQELKRLERRLEELMSTVLQLKEENRSLRNRQDTLSAERSADSVSWRLRRERFSSLSCRTVDISSSSRRSRRLSSCSTGERAADSVMGRTIGAARPTGQRVRILRNLC